MRDPDGDGICEATVLNSPQPKPPPQRWKQAIVKADSLSILDPLAMLATWRWRARRAVGRPAPSGPARIGLACGQRDISYSIILAQAALQPLGHEKPAAQVELRPHLGYRRYPVSTVGVEPRPPITGSSGVAPGVSTSKKS
jgi:hypothetical protein